MIPKRIRNATHEFKPPSGWTGTEAKCSALAVRVLDRDGLVCHESAWEPTPKELGCLIRGGSVVLTVVGGQPPVMLWVEEADAD